MPVTDVRVDDEGIYARSTREVILDVCFDGRRIWSLWSHRDTERHGSGRRATWPPPLADRLDGVTRVTVVPHGDDRLLFDQEMRFGESEQRLTIVNAKGQPLGLDKANKLLDEAGYPRKDGGMRFTLRLDYNPANPDLSQNVAEYMRPQLKKVGIKNVGLRTWRNIAGLKTIDVAAVK